MNTTKVCKVCNKPLPLADDDSDFLSDTSNGSNKQREQHL